MLQLKQIGDFSLKKVLRVVFWIRRYFLAKFSKFWKQISRTVWKGPPWGFQKCLWFGCATKIGSSRRIFWFLTKNPEIQTLSHFSAVSHFSILIFGMNLQGMPLHFLINLSTFSAFFCLQKRPILMTTNNGLKVLLPHPKWLPYQSSFEFSILWLQHIQIWWGDLQEFKSKQGQKGQNKK